MIIDIKGRYSGILRQAKHSATPWGTDMVQVKIEKNHQNMRWARAEVWTSRHGLCDGAGSCGPQPAGESEAGGERWQQHRQARAHAAVFRDKTDQRRA